MGKQQPMMRVKWYDAEVEDLISADMPLENALKFVAKIMRAGCPMVSVQDAAKAIELDLDKAEVEAGFSPLANLSKSPYG